MKTNALWLNALLLLVLFLPAGGQLTLAARPEAIYTTMQHPTLPKDHAFALTDPTVLAQGSGWTWQNPLPQGNNLNAVWGNGPNEVFAVGDHGTILHYDGIEWRIMESSTTQQLKGVWGSSSTDVFVVGGGGVILNYNGSVWNTMNSGTTQDLNCVWGSSANSIFAVGSNGTIQRYNGSNWSKMNSGTPNDLNGIWGNSANEVFVVGANGTIQYYDGNSWTMMNSGTQGYLADIWGSGPNDIFAVGTYILHYDGVSWIQMQEGTSYQLQAVWGTSSSDVFVVGHGGFGVDRVLHYNGSEWQQISRGEFKYLHGVWGNSSESVFAVGWDGIILYYNGSIWSKMNHGTSVSWGGIWGSGSNRIFVVGEGGVILHYNGQQWDTVNSGISESLFGVWGTRDSDVFAVGWDGVILHYDGDQWSQMNSGTDAHLNAVWGTGGGDVFAVGWQGTILHYDGTRWNEMESGDTEWIDLTGVWGSSSDNVYVVGSSTWGRNVVLHYDGSSWSEIAGGVVRNGVWGSGPNDVYIVGGSIDHFDGNTWSVVYSPATQLTKVWGSGPNDVFAVGYDGTILHYDGIAWRTLNSATNNALNGVWGSGPNDVFVVGGSGSILHYGSNIEFEPNDVTNTDQVVHWIVRISVASDGTQGNDRSGEPSISRDGRYVAFSSLADNLVPDDTNKRKDVFVHDLLTRQTTRISVSSTGDQADGGSSQPHISADGRYVTFASTAENLVTADSNNVEDIFVHDRETGETTRVSVSSTGEEGNGKSYAPYISGDGRYVTFVSAASNLVPDDVNSCEPSFSHADGHCPDIFVHDRQTGKTELVSVNSDGRQVNGESGYHSRPSISDDGRYVAFNRWDVDSPSAFVLDRVWIRDRENRTTTTVSVVEYGGWQHSWQPSMSADGLRVAYQSMTKDTISGETNLCRGISGIACPHVYVYDRESGETVRVSVDSQGRQGLDGYSDMPRTSADGNYVVFSSAASNLVPNDTNNYCDTTGDQQTNNSCYDIFIHNLSTSTTTRVSVRPDGEEANNNSYTPAVSAQGEYIAFESSADNLVDDDTNETADVFVVSLLPDAPPPPSTSTTPTQEPLATTAPEVVVHDTETTAPETDVPETETPSPTEAAEKPVDSEVAPTPLRSLGLVVVAVVVLGLFIAGGVGLFVVKRYMPSRMHLAWLGCGFAIVLVLLMAAVAIALLVFGTSGRKITNTQATPTPGVVMTTTMGIAETPADAPATIAPEATLPLVTSTPEASPTPEPTATATFLPTPTEVPTDTPTPACPPVTGTFARVWASMQEQLGCARGDSFQGLVAEENFEGGIMFWREAFDQARSPVLFNNGTWRFYQHTPFLEGSPDFSCLDDHTPAQCPPTPKRGFGLMWCNILELRERLGNATDCERGYYATIQTFDKGSILMNDHGTVYILFDDGTWQR